MTQADDRILETLADSDLILSPHILALNLEYSKAHVSRRLSKLYEAKIVERVDTGAYEITARGRAYLSGDLDTADLENPEDTSSE